MNNSFLCGDCVSNHESVHMESDIYRFLDIYYLVIEIRVFHYNTWIF